MSDKRDRASVRHTTERLLEARQDLAEVGILLLGSEQHPARVVFHFSSDEGHHSIVVEREDWDLLGAEVLAAAAGRRVLSELRLRKSLAATMPWQRPDERRHDRFGAA
jgi:hypothetical protein